MSQLKTPGRARLSLKKKKKKNKTRHKQGQRIKLNGTKIFMDNCVDKMVRERKSSLYLHQFLNNKPFVYKMLGLQNAL